jgi:branched-chain amino acid transport system permease protein
LDSSVLAQGLASGLLIGSVYALIAVGFTLVMGVMRIVNFAHGHLVMVAMYVAFFMFTAHRWDPYLSLAVVVPGMFLLGVVVQRVLFRHVLGEKAFAQIIVSFGLLLILENSILFYFGGDFRTVGTSYTTATIVLGSARISVAQLFAAALAWLTVGALSLFLYRSEFGRAMRACADDLEAAMSVGIDVQRVFQISVGISTMLAGMAGAAIMPFLVAYPTVGIDFGIKAFVITILGGLGSVPGALAGSLLIGVVEQVTSAAVSRAFANAVVFGVLILVLMFRPRGIFGRGQV